jgi:Mg2+ and Co2+ transporter CorA
MDATTAELTSVATVLEEITRRVTSIAEEVAGTKREDMATELFEVERTLVRAQRRLAKVVDAG